MKIITLLLLLTLHSCGTSENNSMENKNDITTVISTTQDIYQEGEPVEISMEVQNNGKKEFRFLPWGTPIEKQLTGDCLEVIPKGGKKLDYIGIMVKRMAPTEKDYIRLQQEETATGKVNVLDGYAMNKKGAYTIQYKAGRGLPASNIITIEIN